MCVDEMGLLCKWIDNDYFLFNSVLISNMIINEQDKQQKQVFEGESPQLTLNHCPGRVKMPIYLSKFLFVNRHWIDSESEWLWSSDQCLQNPMTRDRKGSFFTCTLSSQ